MSQSLVFRIAADVLLFIHTLFVVFVVAGLLLVFVGGHYRWDWVRHPWFRSLHLLAIAVVALQSWFGAICPLTTWEMALRERAGDAVYQGAFIAYWLESLLYYQAPAWVFILAYTLFLLLVAAAWYWVPPRRFKSKE